MNLHYQINRSAMIAFVVCSALLILTNVLLVRKCEALNRQLTNLVEAPVGSKAHPIYAESPAGNKEAIEYGKDHRKTLLLVYSPGCRACAENWPTWQLFASRLDPKAYRVIALDLSNGSASGQSRYSLGTTPILTRIAPETILAYRLRFTPQTILIDKDGRVEHVWTGRLRSRQLNEARRALGIAAN